MALTTGPQSSITPTKLTMRSGFGCMGNAMRDPFLIDSPTCISFSGGRTSAYMLWRVLQSNGGLPSDAVVCFANTGKEEEATLRFVRDCGRHWGVNITWVEYRDSETKFAEVDFDSASRDGEPFEAIIRKRQYLPNPVTRFCTSELKIRTMHRWLRDNWKGLGWNAEDLEWNQMIGIRADEHRRVSKIRARGHSTETTKETMLLPLADAGVTLADIDNFWLDQPFRLELPTHMGRTLAGNCDLCFLKPAGQILSLINQRPERATWWSKMEALALASKPSGAVFRSDRANYAQMQANAADQADAFGHDGETIPCFCGD
jgi:3'-phosphoadenosine 5'-phosphosulfate sulfotransferase (PAPS reductase)/FAD synthetase